MKQVDNVLGEKKRIAKLSQIKDLVLGAQDGLLTSFGVISTVAGAFNNPHILVIAGISSALASGFSMTTGEFLASTAEKQVHKSELNKEDMAIDSFPYQEREEMSMLLESEEVKKKDAKKITDILWKYKKSFTNTMDQKELGIEPDPATSALSDSILVGISCVVAATIPLIPYFFLAGQSAVLVSIIISLITLFSIGLLKARFASLPYLKSGLQVLGVGVVSGIGGYILGSVLPHLLGIK